MEQNKQAKNDSGFAGSFANAQRDMVQCALPESKVCTLGQATIFVLGNVYAMAGTDTVNGIINAEIILSQYLEKGKTFLHSLDGDFTVILASNESVKIIRDFKGSGPQVFYTRNHFSDRLPSLINCENQPFSPDPGDLSFFLKYGYVPPLKSGFEGINRVPAGYMLEYDKGEIHIDRVISNNPKIASTPEKSESEYISGFLEKHTEAIKQRIHNKEHIALLLSGGYDSGGNLAALRTFYTGKVTAYTVSFKDNPFSELEYVKIMADQYGVDLKVHEIDGSELSGLPDIVLQTGAPFQESGMMINYCAMKKIAEDCPDIVLGGDGNDQFFGTGSREIAMRWVANKTGGIWLLRLIRVLTRKLMSPVIIQKIKLYNDKILEIYKPDHWGFTTDELRIKPDEKSAFPESGTGSLKEMIEYKRKNIDFLYTINEVILFKASRMAAHFGNTISFPYLTLDLMDYIDALPLKYKIKGSLIQMIRGKGKSKYLHKISYQDSLPPSITGRKKQGGFVPLSIFFNNPDMNMRVFNIIENSDLLDELLKDKSKIVKELKTSLKSPNPWFWAQQSNYFRIFNLLVLAIWERLMIRNEKPEDIRSLFYGA
jgi:asparagine synthase (glutamine-hydrolysing)